ncbi:MAG: hypothetical protein JNL07_12955, partial [Rhodospirillales bacterium]|nr:hypothetical protein [Rhodospirillales bacterium]
MTALSNSRVAWFNGRIVPENQVMIPFRDRSWKYGDGAFDMTRTFEGAPFRLKEHIDRFYRSLRYLRIAVTMTSAPSRKYLARLAIGIGRTSITTFGPVCSQPSSPTASTPRLTRWPTHQSPASARRCSLRATTSSLCATISDGEI